MTSHIPHRLIAGLCATAVGVLGFASAASAQTPASTIAIHDCHVQRSPTTHLVWFSCGVTADYVTNISADYRSNLAVVKPKTIGPWNGRTGKLRFSGGGQEVESLKFAVRDKSLTVRQVEKRVRVTLSNVKGGTITDAVARASTN